MGLLIHIGIYPKTICYGGMIFQCALSGSIFDSWIKKNSVFFKTNNIKVIKDRKKKSKIFPKLYARNISFICKLEV